MRFAKGEHEGLDAHGAIAAVREFLACVPYNQDIPDRRRAEGKMYGQVGVILFSIIAMLSGARSYRQIHTLIDQRLAILNAASAAEVAQLSYPLIPVSLLMKDQFRSDARIGAITVPTLVLHGELDRVVPIAFGERLYAAIRAPKIFVRFAKENTRASTPTARSPRYANSWGSACRSQLDRHRDPFRLILSHEDLLRLVALVPLRVV